MALFGLFGDSVKPGLQDNPLDSGTEDLINQQRTRVNTSPGDFSNRTLEGTDASTQLAGANAAREDKQRALGGDDQKALSDAINTKYKKIYDSGQNDLRRTAEAQGHVQHFNAMKQFQANAAKRLALNTDRVNQQRAFQYNQQAARNQAISSIIGAVGMVIGGVIGGAPGAKAGSDATAPGNTSSNVGSGSGSGSSQWRLNNDPNAYNYGYGN